MERAKGALRTRVGAATGVRFTPTLTFVLDMVPETSREMEELLAKARPADAEVARIRQGADPGWGRFPYRVPGAEESGGEQCTITRRPRGRRMTAIDPKAEAVTLPRVRVDRAWCREVCSNARNR